MKVQVPSVELRVGFYLLRERETIFRLDVFRTHFLEKPITGFPNRFELGVFLGDALLGRGLYPFLRGTDTFCHFLRTDTFCHFLLGTDTFCHLFRADTFCHFFGTDTFCHVRCHSESPFGIPQSDTFCQRTRIFLYCVLYTILGKSEMKNKIYF